MDKKNVAVFFGGRSCEHEISIITGLQFIDYLDTNKIVWVLIWNETVLETNEGQIVFWEYQRGYTGGGNRQAIGYMTTGDSHVGYGVQNWTVEAHNGYVTAGWRSTDLNCFDGAATYQYLIVSEI